MHALNERLHPGIDEEELVAVLYGGACMPVKKKRCLLSGETVRSLDVLYDEIARQLAFPEHFGRNLDALWDVLSADIEGPNEVVWKDPDASRRAMGKGFDRILTVLKEVEKTRKDFRLRLGRSGP